VYQISEHLFYSFGAIFGLIHQDIVRSRMAIEVSTGQILKEFHDKKMKWVPTTERPVDRAISQ
jgi:hypothetical protein